MLIVGDFFLEFFFVLSWMVSRFVRWDVVIKNIDFGVMLFGF